MKCILPAALILFLASASAPAFAASPPPAEAEKYASAVSDAEHWGQLMFDHDQAAWQATDIVAKDPAAKADHRFRGWITESTDVGIRVAFIGEENGKFVGLYETTPSSGSDFVTDSPARELTPDELAEFTARQTARTAMTSGCSDRYNTVVLPEGSGNDKKWRVYLMPGVKDPNIIPLGGYFRYVISQDGKTILEQRPFTKTCAMFPIGNLPKGATLAGVSITHLLDPQPTEVHVFVSLTYKQPVFVITTQNALMWEVSGNSIQVKDKIQPSPQSPTKP